MKRKTKMETKYELIPEGSLYRLKALKDFGTVKAGDLGGLVSGEHNLSQDGSCWVFGEAWVSGKARVRGEAKVSGEAMVFGKAEVSGGAEVSGEVEIYE